MIVLCANLKRVQVGPFGKEGKQATILTVEWQEQNTRSGRVQDRVSDFFVSDGAPGLTGLKEGDPVNMEVRPWSSGKEIRYEFVRLVGKSGKA